MAEALLSSPSSSRPLPRNDNFELLCAGASARPVPEKVASIANWNYEGFDWSGFLQLAEHHGVLALLARNLAQHVPDVSAEIAQSLRTAYAENLRRNLWFAGELTRILEHFEERSVRAIPYKGPVLAQSAYGDLGLRSFSDLDLLITPADFDRVKGALGEIGYHPSQELAPALERLFLRTGYERSFDGEGGKYLVELQWNLLPYLYAIEFQTADFRIEDLLARAGHVSLGAAEVPRLSPEDSLLVLCLHAAKHLWTRLIWLADIAESLRAADLDCALVTRRARAMGVARILGVSCWLAERLLGAAIPAAARQLVDGDAEVAKLGEEYATRLARSATYNLESSEYFRQVWRLRERSSDRWRYLRRLAWTPGPGEIAAIELPEILFPLYRVVRIGRLLRRLL
jgi:hypothetical protein